MQLLAKKCYALLKQDPALKGVSIKVVDDQGEQVISSLTALAEATGRTKTTLAREAILEYIGYYNTQRRHSSLGYVPPSHFERRWRAEIEKRTEA